MLTLSDLIITIKQSGRYMAHSLYLLFPPPHFVLDIETNKFDLRAHRLYDAAQLNNVLLWQCFISYCYIPNMC